MRKTAPATGATSLQERVAKELKAKWWLWGSIVFAVLLVGSLVVFRESLYDGAKHGLPFLAGTPPLTSSLLFPVGKIERQRSFGRVGGQQGHALHMVGMTAIATGHTNQHAGLELLPRR